MDKNGGDLSHKQMSHEDNSLPSKQAIAPSTKHDDQGKIAGHTNKHHDEFCPQTSLANSGHSLVQAQAQPDRVCKAQASDQATRRLAHQARRLAHQADRVGKALGAPGDKALDASGKALGGKALGAPGDKALGTPGKALGAPGKAQALGAPGKAQALGAPGKAQQQPG